MLFRRIPVLHPHAERCVLGDKLVAVVAYRPSPLRQAEAAAAPLLSLKDPQSVLLSADDPSTISYRLHPDCSSTSNPATSWLLLPKKPGKTPPESTSTKYPYSLIYPGDSSGVMAEHLSQSELDYPFKLLEYFNGFRVSKVIFSACELGVFDLLLKSQEPLSAQHVARELSTSVDGMESLLDALVGIEILEVETTDGTAFYSSTDVANLYLAKGSGKSLHDMIVYYSQTIYPLWNNMVDAVRDGKNQNEKTFGLPSEEVFQAIYRSEEEMLKFMGLMNSSWVLDGHDIVTAFNLSCFQTIVDLGGCTGALAREVAKAYPTSSVTVFDLPQIVETAQKHFCQENDAVSFQSGDFFEGEIPPADLYVLARIIHDWPEEKCLTLLKRIYDVCKPGGGVLLVEALLFENRRGPVMAQLFSLNMLVQTEGKERPPSDYTHMLEKTGFSNVQVCRTGKSYDAILAIR